MGSGEWEDEILWLAVPHSPLPIPLFRLDGALSSAINSEHLACDEARVIRR
jgi:hypothetical protein